jgi:hypothetical protein
VQAFQLDADLEPTGVVEKATAEQLLALLHDENRWIIPTKDEIDAPPDQMSLFVEVMTLHGIPLAFATALAEQEGNMDHFDSDGFVKLRIEFWGQYKKGDHPDYQIRYRSYGMLQILMTYQSMFDNLEQATFSRSNQYPEHFLSEWERLKEELKEE